MWDFNRNRPWLSHRFDHNSKMTLTCTKSKVRICIQDTPRGPNFHLFRSMMDHFLTPDAQIFICFALWWTGFRLCHCCRKSALNDPKWPWHVQGQKYQHASYIHPWGQNFHPFALRWSVFELRKKFVTCTLNDQMTTNDLHMFKVKILICKLHTAPRPTILFVLLYNEPFSKYEPNLQKVCQMARNYLDMFKVKYTNMHTT